MGKASRTKQAPDRRARVAAQRAAAQRAERRRRLYLAGGSIVVVILVVVGFVIFRGKGSSPSSSGASNGPTGAALTSVVNQVTSVPASTLDQVGSGSGQVTSKPITLKGGTLLKSGGKPEMLYMGAEYCPYCAAERWSMIVALSRFGTFTGLQTVHSASKNGAGDAEPNPNTPTWTFVHATYTSNYLTFVPVEMYTNIPDTQTGEYTTLQTPTSAEEALLNKWDVPPYVPQGYNGSIPFIDFGNKYMVSGASYEGSVLDGHTWAQDAAALKDPSSSVAKGVDGTANYITAAICKLTNNQPASACTSTVQSLEGQL
jgi:thiol-disulfide isomerase/thioredoxin